MDKFFNALDNFFSFVRKHYSVFFWLCWMYYIALIVLQTVFELSETIAAIAVIPTNLFSWPVFLETRKIKPLPMMMWRVTVCLPVVSTMLPLLWLLDF